MANDKPAIDGSAKTDSPSANTKSVDPSATPAPVKPVDQPAPVADQGSGTKPVNQADKKDQNQDKNKVYRLPSLPSLPPLPKLVLPKLQFPQWRLGLAPLFLMFMAVGYVVVSRQFILLMYKKRVLALSGITILLILPLVTACAEYSLMRWGYLISGVLIIGGLIIIVKSPASWILIALVSWLGLLGMVISGEILTSQKIKIWLVVML